MASINSTDIFSDELTALDTRKLRRVLPVFEQTEGVRLYAQGQSLLNFSSNNYLGLTHHPRVLEAVREVLMHWGTGATSSRLIGGTSIIHQDLERALAAFMQTEAALVFPTGYMTNLGVITALVGEGDAIVMDRLCHASLIDAARLSGARLLVYQHADPEDAERVLQRAASYRRRLLVTDSLFSMDGDFAPLQELSQLARRYGAISVLDEAHAIGVWGEGGRGARFMPGRTGEWDLVVGTLSKALASQGGFACGSQILIDLLVNKARSFIFTTGLSPMCVAAAHATLSLIQEDHPSSAFKEDGPASNKEGSLGPSPRTQLQQLSAQLRTRLREKGFNTLNSESQIIPILLGDVETTLACSKQLAQAGIFAPAIRPPTVHVGECRIRFSLTAEHQVKDIDKLMEALSAHE